ncbi:MAG: AraC family transcriptional regulator, partial [Eubacteriales bacterium]|nr:AraC family transcriptional regulator [Eubacteriales bacterium]
WENLAAIFDGLDQDTTRVSSMDRHENLACQIASYIEEHLAEPLNNSILGKTFGLAPSYLSVIFRNKKGVSPIEYIALQRINRAKTLFCDSPHLTSKEIATLVGFDDPFHFSKSFKKLTGLSPAEYRKTNCQS